eukprot:6186755-Pleurochrysis_carterae.AAC.1
MPPIECDLPWMRKALEPRHLRGMEVGCGAAQRCVWMPYPHHVDGWCSQIDMLNFVDFEDLVAQGSVSRSRARRVPVETLSMLPLTNASADTVVGAAEPHEVCTLRLPNASALDEVDGTLSSPFCFATAVIPKCSSPHPLSIKPPMLLRVCVPISLCAIVRTRQQCPLCPVSCNGCAFECGLRLAERKVSDVPRGWILLDTGTSRWQGGSSGPARIVHFSPLPPPSRSAFLSAH